MFSYALGRYIEKYDCIFYTNPYDVPLINDGERSMSESFRSQIIKLYEELILGKYPNIYVLEGSVESRYNKMIEDILKDLRELRNEMVQANWPAQRLSNIILKYEMKLQDEKSKFTNDEIVEATNKILND